MPSSDTPSDHLSTTPTDNEKSCFYVYPGPFSWVRVSGADAVRFVDSFTTAAVSRLADGQGSESFFTDVRGQVICMAGLLRCGPDTCEEPAVEIMADGRVGAALAEHLERYHIREAIEIEDVSSARQTFALMGPAVAALVAAVVTDSRMPADLARSFDHAAATLACGNGHMAATRLVRCDWAGPQSWLVACLADDAEKVSEAFTTAGLTRGDGSRWEQARIEAGTPQLCDLLPKTLPQELGRDSRAISFTKGCYLGQETVARLDALGHVNRQLTGIAIEGIDVPPPGTAIIGGSETIGQLTSSCFSHTLGQPLGLAILPSKSLASGPPLTVEGRPARLISLPLQSANQAESGADPPRAS